MFLMLNSWRETDRHATVEDRLAKAMGETAVSIMITALTDGLSFSVGSISIFPAVRKSVTVVCEIFSTKIFRMHDEYVFLYHKYEVLEFQARKTSSKIQ